VGDIVNLNKFRKRKSKATREQRAVVNRTLHGRTKAERAREALQKQQLTRKLDGAKLDEPSDASDAKGSEPPESA
jgi:hypothetical protein